MTNPFAYLKEKPAEFFHLIPQVGVTHLHCEADPQHNAVWDMAVSPEGRIFFSSCGESYLSLYARLYEYDHKQKKLIRHLALEDAIATDPTGLRISKFHTALSFIGGGRILTTTHTTSPAPSHPQWMPYEYAGHPYEQYQGSHLMIYNYLTGESKGLGMISYHDTTYGGIYDAKNGDYFCTTWMRGEGIVYNLHTGERRSLGQVTDSHTSRMFTCSDGHLYGSTFTGALFRWNTDLRDIEYLGVSASGLMRFARERDGILYFTTGTCSTPGAGQELFAYNLKTRELKVVGRPVPVADADKPGPNVFYNAYGMDFDSQGRLWYGCMTFVPGIKYSGAKLFMWDFLNGRDPVDCGFLGTPKRTIAITSELHIVNDVLYVSDSNHVCDRDLPCGILAIDLDEFVPALETAPRIFSHDYINYLPYPAECFKYYPKDDFDDCFARWSAYYKDTVQYYERFTRDNAPRYPYAAACGVSVWETTGRADSAVRKIEWTGDDSFTFYCGRDNTWRGEVSVGTQAHLEKLEACTAPAYSELHAAVQEVKLPAVPGRRYLAQAEASVALPDGSIVVGTKDTILARIDGEHVFGLGQVCTAGGVHSLACDATGRVWGVAGHDRGVGQIFTYTVTDGVQLLGICPEVKAESGRNVSIYRPVTLALSPNGRYLAIGGADELGGVVVLDVSGV